MNPSPGASSNGQDQEPGADHLLVLSSRADAILRYFAADPTFQDRQHVTLWTRLGRPWLHTQYTVHPPTHLHIHARVEVSIKRQRGSSSPLLLPLDHPGVLPHALSCRVTPVGPFRCLSSPLLQVSATLPHIVDMGSRPRAVCLNVFGFFAGRSSPVQWHSPRDLAASG